MSAVENKMNTEVNTEMMTETITEQIVNETPKTKKPKIVKKKVETKKTLAIEGDEVEENKVSVETEKVSVEIPVAVPVAVDVEFEEDIDEVEEKKEEDELVVLMREQEEIARRIRRIENQKKVKTDITKYRKILAVHRKAEIKKFEDNVMFWQEALKNKTEELSAMDDLNDDELMNAILCNPDLEKELGLNGKVSAKPAVKKAVNKPVAKKDDDVSSLSSSEKTTSKSQAIAQRQDQWKSIKEGTKFEMTYNKSGRIYTKKGDGLVGADGKEYKSLNDAIRKYKLEINDQKSFGSAWSLFRIIE
jgi:hypothetical protein